MPATSNRPVRCHLRSVFPRRTFLPRASLWWMSVRNRMMFPQPIAYSRPPPADRQTKHPSGPCRTIFGRRCQCEPAHSHLSSHPADAAMLPRSSIAFLPSAPRLFPWSPISAEKTALFCSRNRQSVRDSIPRRRQPSPGAIDHKTGWKCETYPDSPFILTVTPTTNRQRIFIMHYASPRNSLQHVDVPPRQLNVS